MNTETVNGIPRTERIWLEYHAGQDTYYITSKNGNTDMFFVYRMDGDRAEKLGKSKSPPELERKYIRTGKDDG